MKNWKLPVLIALLAMICSCIPPKANGPKTKKLRHVVAFKFKPEITAEQMQKVTSDFYGLKAQIQQIIEFEGGPDIAAEKKIGKYTHCFIVTVKSEKDLATYGTHPAHKAFSKSVDPLLAEVMVVDYWAE